MVQIKEKTIEEIEEKLEEMKTPLNKIAYLESALKENFTFKLKREILSKIAELYEFNKMLEKAAKAISNKAGIEVSFRDKIESYLKAAELYARLGKINDAELMFTRAARVAQEQRENSKVELAKKNIFLTNAKSLERQGKKGAAAGFYEALIKMRLDDMEKQEVKERLIDIYKSLGKFREAKRYMGM